MGKSDRTIDNLTNQLCVYEKALSCKSDNNQEALFAERKGNTKPKYKKNLICHYCKKPGHIVWQCTKWKADGRPPKKEKTVKNERTEKDNATNMTLIALTSNVLAIECDHDHWFVDNGATNHITHRNDLFETFEYFNDSYKVTTANGDSVGAVGKGSITVEAFVNGQPERITLSDVWYVPSIKKNLFSVLSAQDKHLESEFQSKSEVCKLIISGKVKLVGKRCRYGGLFKLSLRNVKPTKESQANVTCNDNVLQLYHERLGHQNKRHIKTFLSHELGIHVDLDSELCEGCIYGKAHRRRFGTRERAKAQGELMHSDVCGPFVNSMSGYRYFVIFKDDYSKFRYVYFIKEKSEVPDKLKIMLAETKATGHVVKELLSDNGGEFDSSKFREILEQNGIRQRLTMPYSPQQNGCSERDNRTIVETARSIMHAHEELPQGLWAEMINTATYILNRSGVSGIEGKTPYEIWIGRKPSVKHLRIVGSSCYAHVPKQCRKKMEKKAVKGILIGYDNNDGYRIWCNATRKLIRSRDVSFDEKPLVNKSATFAKEGTWVQLKNEPKENETQEEDLQEEVVEDGVQEGEDEGRESDENDYENSEARNLRDRSKIKKPIRFENNVMNASVDILEIFEPLSYEEAMRCDQQEEWSEAMTQELKSLNENETWVLEKLPQGKKAIPCKWVYKIKSNPDGSVEKYKARLVIKGFSQRKGEDYDQTFSPVAKSGTIRALISIAASENMSLTQFDVSTAFLYGKLEEEVFMKQPEGYVDGSDSVCRLQRSLYGLKQAPRCWNKRFSDFLIKLGFVKSDADPCLFVKKEEKDILLIALYVDDGLLASNNLSLKEDFIRSLKKEFKITVKPASYYLGLEIERIEDGSIRISQLTYTKKLLERFGMANCKMVSTPITKEQNQPGKDDEPRTEHFPYRQAVGALMYLMTGTRPDIAYAVSVASRTLENPSWNDWIRVKRIFRYLQGTSSYGIIYRSDCKGYLKGFSDADHGGDESTGRSTTGVVCTYANGAISWMSQRQTSVAISTTEAEVVAASEGARELIWLKRLLDDIGVLKETPELMVDNEAAIKLAQNPEYHRRTKHIRIRHFYVRELVTEGSIKVTKISTEFQVADIMTKPLFKPRYQDLCKCMNLGLRAENVMKSTN